MQAIRLIRECAECVASNEQVIVDALWEVRARERVGKDSLINDANMLNDIINLTRILHLGNTKNVNFLDVLLPLSNAHILVW